MENRKREGKRGRETEKEERRGENRESDTKNVPPSLDAFPSTKLGNNITPTKGKLGKNITPTSRGQPKPNAGSDPYVDPLRRQPSLDASLQAYSSYALKREEGSKYRLHSKGAAIYKEAKALEKSHGRFHFSINQH